MAYPFWSVPGLTAPMLIAAVSVIHVFISMYAVGGGLFLARETAHAYRTRDTLYLGYLRRHAGFFALLTLVGGGVTGVGIWWTIGLASPLATAMLLRVFLFFWATEWAAFLVEIAAILAFWKGWGRLPPALHRRIGWIYAGAAWLSLALITPITSFMLTPGDWRGEAWRAIANPQALPQIVARTGAALLLATLYVYLHAAFRADETVLRETVAGRSARPAMAGALLILLGGAGWYLTLPAGGRAALQGAAALNILAALIFALTVIVFAMFYLGPYGHPAWLSPGFAILLFVLGLMVTAAGEFVREAVRKPFVIAGEVYGHNVLAAQVPSLRTGGWLDGGPWTRRATLARYPGLADAAGRISPARMAKLPEADRIAIGRAIFATHCGSCHAASGYAGMRETLPGWTGPMLDDLILHLDRFRYFMPPWSGTPQEAEALRRYLETLAAPHPLHPQGAG